MQWFPLHAVEGRRIRSLVTGALHEVPETTKLVDATRTRVEIPATHPPRYDVEDGVALVPINDLPRVAGDYESYGVVGGGKTGIDAVLWLLRHGVAPKRISWIVPNDAWMFVREAVTPPFAEGTGFEAATFFRLFDALELGNLTHDSLAAALETAGAIHRIDPGVTPTKFKFAIASRVPGGNSGSRRRRGRDVVFAATSRQRRGCSTGRGRDADPPWVASTPLSRHNDTYGHSAGRGAAVAATRMLLGPVATPQTRTSSWQLRRRAQVPGGGRGAPSRPRQRPHRPPRPPAIIDESGGRGLRGAGDVRKGREDRLPERRPLRGLHRRPRRILRSTPRPRRGRSTRSRRRGRRGVAAAVASRPAWRRHDRVERSSLPPRRRRDRVERRVSRRHRGRRAAAPADYRF